MRLYASVTPHLDARVRRLAWVEGWSLSKTVGTLIREAVEARAVERERISREFDTPPGLWMEMRA